MHVRDSLSGSLAADEGPQDKPDDMRPGLLAQVPGMSLSGVSPPLVGCGEPVQPNGKCKAKCSVGVSCAVSLVTERDRLVGVLEKRFSRGRHSGEHISNAFSGRRRLQHDGKRIDDFILLGRRPNYLNIILSVLVH